MAEKKDHATVFVRALKMYSARDVKSRSDQCNPLTLSCLKFSRVIIISVTIYISDHKQALKCTVMLLNRIALPPHRPASLMLASVIDAKPGSLDYPS